MSFGVQTFIDEIVEGLAIYADVGGKSVNVTGRLSEHDIDDCIAKLVDPQTKKELTIDTSLIEPFGARLGSLFQMIGELETIGSGDFRTSGSGDFRTKVGNCVVLKARVVRCVDGMDLALYRKALQLQREFLSKKDG